MEKHGWKQRDHFRGDCHSVGKQCWWERNQCNSNPNSNKIYWGAWKAYSNIQKNYQKYLKIPRIVKTFLKENEIKPHMLEFLPNSLLRTFLLNFSFWFLYHKFFPPSYIISICSQRWCRISYLIRRSKWKEARKRRRGMETGREEGKAFLGGMNLDKLNNLNSLCLSFLILKPGMIIIVLISCFFVISIYLLPTIY